MYGWEHAAPEFQQALACPATFSGQTTRRL
jgi:hypothetical protein